MIYHLTRLCICHFTQNHTKHDSVYVKLFGDLGFKYLNPVFEVEFKLPFFSGNYFICVIMTVHYPKSNRIGSYINRI
jgi:hypothetical protein